MALEFKVDIFILLLFPNVNPELDKIEIGPLIVCEELRSFLKKFPPAITVSDVLVVLFTTI